MLDLDNEDSILAELLARDINTPIGGLIEEFLDRFPVTEGTIPVFERFLDSADVDNRSAALLALVEYGQRLGYEADALVLHYQTRSGGSPEEYAALRFLRLMSERGSASAARAWALLGRDEYVTALFAEPNLRALDNMLPGAARSPRTDQ